MCACMRGRAKLEFTIAEFNIGHPMYIRYLSERDEEAWIEFVLRDESCVVRTDTAVPSKLRGMEDGRYRSLEDDKEISYSRLSSCSDRRTNRELDVVLPTKRGLR